MIKFNDENGILVANLDALQTIRVNGDEMTITVTYLEMGEIKCAKFTYTEETEWLFHQNIDSAHAAGYGYDEELSNQVAENSITLCCESDRTDKLEEKMNKLSEMINGTNETIQETHEDNGKDD